MYRFERKVIFTILVCFLFAIILGGKMPYLIFYTISGAFTISCLWCINTSRKLTSYQKVRKKEFNVGDTIEIETFTENDSLLPVPYVEVADLTLKDINGGRNKTSAATLMPSETELMKNKLQLNYRGVYDVGPVKIRVYDIFRVFSHEIMFYSDLSFKVYPRVYNFENFALKSIQSFGTLTVKQKAFEDYSAVSDIKKYFPGDSIKKVHWKISAKRGELFVKNYEMTGSASVCLFLDFKKDSYKGNNFLDLEERSIETSASIISFMLKNKVSVEMYVNSSKLNFTKGRDIKEIKKFLDVLCEVRSNGNSSMGDIIEKRIRLISKGTSIIVISGKITDSDAITYCSSKEIGYDVILIYINDKILDNHILSMINSYEIKYYWIKSDSNIKGVLESL
jgi:uncharacterized protein (DUF58 family)